MRKKQFYALVLLTMRKWEQEMVLSFVAQMVFLNVCGRLVFCCVVHEGNTQVNLALKLGNFVFLLNITFSKLDHLINKL